MINQYLDDRAAFYSNLSNDEAFKTSISAAAGALIEGFKIGGKLLVCGNGGSAALADHMVGELVGRYKLAGRRALPAIALTNNSTNSAIANDFEYRQVFSYQLEAFNTHRADTLVLFTTSGRSKNILKALEIAKNRNLYTIVICGGDTSMVSSADIVVSVPATRTDLIQEAHQSIVHIICEEVDICIGVADGG